MTYEVHSTNAICIGVLGWNSTWRGTWYTWSCKICPEYRVRCQCPCLKEEEDGSHTRWSRAVFPAPCAPLYCQFSSLISMAKESHIEALRSVQDRHVIGIINWKLQFTHANFWTQGTTPLKSPTGCNCTIVGTAPRIMYTHDQHSQDAMNAFGKGQSGQWAYLQAVKHGHLHVNNFFVSEHQVQFSDCPQNTQMHVDCPTLCWFKRISVSTLLGHRLEVFANNLFRVLGVGSRP